MNVKHLFSLRSLFVYFTILAFCIVLFVLTRHFIVEKLDQQREQIVTKIKEEFGLPIHFDEMKTTWFGFTLGISLQNVTIYDPTVPIPFLSMQSIKVYPSVSSVLFKSELQFGKLILEGLKLVVGWDKKNGFVILGLQGEAIPGIIEYETLMKLLSKQESIVIKDSEIEWQGPSLKVKQFWTGEFKWVRSKTIDWMLSGEQQLQIREDLSIPSNKFMLSLSPDLKTIALNIEGKGLVSQCRFISSENKAWEMDCKGDLQDLDIASIHQIYQPKKTDALLLQWLANSLEAGKIKKASIQVSGALDALQTEGKIVFSNVDFQYANDWPKIYDAKGFIDIERGAVNVQLSSGKLMDAEIEKASAFIAPLSEQKSPTVEVQGIVKSTLQDGLLFLKESPLRENLANYLEPLDPSGTMRLNLHLSIPLEEKMPTQVRGDLAVEEGEIVIPNTNLELEELTGNFHFTENTIESSHLNADLDHKSLNIQVKTLPVSNVSTLEIMTKGSFDTSFLQEEFHFPILERLYGESLFTVTVRRPLITKDASNKTEWIITSDLQGMAIQLPSFLGKKQEEIRPMTVVVSEAGKNTWKLAFSFKDLLDAKLLFEKDTHALKQGQIVLGKGEATWNTKEALFVNGEIKSFRVTDWQEFFDSADVAKAKHFSKMNIHVFVDELEMYGLNFNKTWITSDFNVIPLQWKLEGPSIKGNVSFPPSAKDSIVVDLEHLKIMTKYIATNDTLSFLSGQTKFPLEFHCKHFQYEEGDFGEVSFKLSPSHYGYTIEYLNAETKFSELSSRGEWHLSKGHAYTVLEGKMMASNMGHAFSAWGYPSTIQESSGYIKYYFTWAKHPFQFDIDLVEGTAEVKLDKGRIVGVNPGLGRIMGLLNLESIRRRLQLDFSDLFKKGFVFDNLFGKFDFQQGTAYTKKLSIDGPSAKIALDGSTHLKDKTIDLNMLVTPHMGIGIPIAGAIAAGPAGVAVGTGVWILDKITGSRINKITEHKYKVTGTWEAPIIKELGAKELRTRE